MREPICLVVIDDEVLMEHVFEGIFFKELNEGSIQFKFFNNPEVGLDYLRRELNRSDHVLITDLNMPGMSGTELISKLNEEGLRARTFIISAYDMEFIKDDMRTIPVEGYFTKPLDVMTMRAQILP